jgi:exodeoxyribonuclease VII small subunit
MSDMTFESAYAELEKIVQQLEEGNLALDETVSLFERARALARYCQTQLDQAELRVTQLGSEAQKSP